jgi:hypothetical protein
MKEEIRKNDISFINDISFFLYELLLDLNKAPFDSY